MPIFINKSINGLATVAVWHITEDKKELYNMLTNGLTLDKYLPDNLHWLASRALIANIFKNTNYKLFKNEANKPFLKVDDKNINISITHSGKYAAILFSQTKQVGIDLEKTDERINRVARKFINVVEESYAKTIAHKTIIWSAKETLFKLYAKGNVDFRQNLIIYPFIINKNGSIKTEIEKDETNLFYTVNYQFFDDMVLTYCIN
ncbi:MAG: 4'-phosphopantetheinyl transferase family protein [Bacteroidia bacterium]